MKERLFQKFSYKPLEDIERRPGESTRNYLGRIRNLIETYRSEHQNGSSDDASRYLRKICGMVKLSSEYLEEDLNGKSRRKAIKHLKTAETNLDEYLSHLGSKLASSRKRAPRFLGTVDYELKHLRIIINNSVEG